MVTLQDLPEDAKRLICAELYSESNELVRALWQVSKTWRIIAEPFVYRGFILTTAVSADGVIKVDVKQLREHEFARKYLEHGRYILINTIRLWIEEERKKFPADISPMFSALSLTEPMDPSFDSVFSRDAEEDREYSFMAWEPLVTLLPDFQHLTDIVLQFAHYGNGIPPGLVPAIEKHHPKCRLHLRNFRFKSLREEVTDPYERALVTSPNLHSMNIMYQYRLSNGQDDHNEAAALRTVALAPNLKHVRMLECRPASSAELYQARDRPLEPWKGFVPPIEEPDKPKTRLETLAFVGYSNCLSLEKLAKWEAVADFSTLKAFSCSIRSSAIIHHLIISNTLPSVVDLTLILEPSTRDDLSGWEPAVDGLLSTLNPLQSLSISGTLHSSLFHVIAERHGETLQELSLKPSTDGYDMPPPYHTTASDVGILAAACPRLTSISLTLKRSMGDRTETRCYEAIGTLHNLKSVKLDLDCENGNAWSLHPEPEWDDFDKTTQSKEGERPKYWNGHLKRAIINSALDETLAREIYSVLNSNRRKDCLDSLQLRTCNGSSFDKSHTCDLMTIVEHVSRSYRLTRTVGQDGKEDVQVVELSKEKREKSDAWERESEQRWVGRHGKGSMGLKKGSWTVFRHIWPFGEDEDWRNVWKSWPLERGEGTEMAA